MKSGGLLQILAIGALLSGCSWNPIDALSPSPPPPAAPPPMAASPAAFPVDRLIGEWGVASYRDEKDRVRTEAQARAACKQPYVITKGPTDGVIMYVADDTTPHELTLKGGPNGKTYLGFAGPPADDQDREILTFTDKMFVARYLDPDTNNRYGTLVYVRCNASKSKAT
jgi:hypothetical protein